MGAPRPGVTHTLRSFTWEVTLEKMGIHVGQRDAMLTIFNAMAVTRSDQAFGDINISTASTYLSRNWLHIKHEWTRCFKLRRFTLGEVTNNRLESFNGKVKTNLLPVCIFGCLLRGPLPFAASSRISSLCCVCCVVWRNTLSPSTGSAQHRIYLF